MAILSRSKKAPADAAAPKAPKATKASKKVEVAKAEAPRDIVATPAKLVASTYVLTSPRVSEKAARLASRGVYVFNVPVSANKVEVRKAVEAVYNVKVESVNTVRGEGKLVRRGRTEGRRNNWKKALVTLKPGQKIDLYEGV